MIVLATSVLDPFYSFVYKFVVKFVNWLITAITAPAVEQLNAINNAIPNLNQGYQDSLVPYIGFVNLWFPVDWLFTLMTAYVILMFSAMTIKWIMKFVPGF